MVVSFILVVFNEAKALPMVHHALTSLRLPDGVSIETIVVDGGSRDNSLIVARTLGFTHLLERPGANIPSCRNVGLEAATGDWIAFVDADCVLDQDWLMHAARLLQTRQELILGWPAAPPEPGTWVQRAWHAHWMNKNPAQETIQGERVVVQGGFRMITTRNMIFHRSIAERIGGFDEKLSTGEDTDFVFRASMAGIPTWGLPALKSVHLGEPATLRKFFKQQIWHANRQAYKTILEKSGMKSGGNAPLFTGLFFGTLVMALGGILAALTWHPVLALLVAPLPALVLLLAARTCMRARKLNLLLPLAILYAAYGLARVIDLVGLSPHKRSWKH